MGKSPDFSVDYSETSLPDPDLDCPVKFCSL